MIKRGLLILLGTVVVAAIAGQATAQTTEPVQESRLLSDKFQVKLGGARGNFSTTVAAGTNSLGVFVRVEDVLGFDEDATSGALSGFYRIGRKNRHAFSFALSRFDRDSSGILNESPSDECPIGGLPVFGKCFDGNFSSEFNVQILSLSYRYSFVNTGKTEAGFVMGLSAYGFEFKLDGALVGVGGPSAVVSSNKTDFLAPLPTFGFFVNYAITPRLIFGAAAGALDLDVGDISGRVLNTNVKFSYYFIRHLGIGVGLGSTDISYENLDQGDLFAVEYKQKAATIFISGVF